MKYLWLMSAALVACASDEAATMPTTVTSAGLLMQSNDAIEQITSDSCNRQLSCGNVGRGRSWSDRRDCEVDTQKAVVARVGASCAAVDASRLARCIHALRDQRCEDARTYPPACEGSRLCR